MADTAQHIDIQDKRIAVTLKLEPGVHEFFSHKAQAAGVEIDTYLCSTLSIVLGCRAFSKMSPCTPESAKDECSADDSK